MQVSWQPLGPLLKVELLVGYRERAVVALQLKSH